jgi:hypothetical protein
MQMLDRKSVAPTADRISTTLRSMLDGASMQFLTPVRLALLMQLLKEMATSSDLRIGGTFRTRVCWRSHGSPLPQSANQLTYSQLGDYIRADRSTEVGRQVDLYSYGSVDSKPAVVHEKIYRE